MGNILDSFRVCAMFEDQAKTILQIDLRDEGSLLVRSKKFPDLLSKEETHGTSDEKITHQKYSIHPSLNSPRFNMIKMSQNIRRNGAKKRPETVAKLTSAVKSGRGFCSIFTSTIGLNQFLPSELEGTVTFKVDLGIMTGVLHFFISSNRQAFPLGLLAHGFSFPEYRFLDINQFRLHFVLEAFLVPPIQAAFTIGGATTPGDKGDDVIGDDAVHSPERFCEMLKLSSALARSGLPKVFERKYSSPAIGSEVSSLLQLTKHGDPCMSQQEFHDAILPRINRVMNLNFTEPKS